MKLLVLGGTRFLGRHWSTPRSRAATTSRSSRAACTPVPWGVGGHAPRRQPRSAHRARPRGARRRRVGRGDRHERLRAALRRARRRALLDGARRALHVRLVDVRVRRREPRRGSTKPRPSRTLADPASEDIAGALRRAEGALRGRGPRGVRRARARSCARGSSSARIDPTDRFAYWVARFLRPELLGASAARPRSCPRRPTRSVQFIDARDLADVDARPRGRADRRHVQCVQPAGHVDDGHARRRARRARLQGGGRTSCRAWVDDATLARARRRAVDRAAAVDSRDRIRSRRGLHGVLLRARDRARARASARSQQTIDDTAAWLAQRDNRERVAQRPVGRQGGRAAAGGVLTAARPHGRRLR